MSEPLPHEESARSTTRVRESRGGSGCCACCSVVLVFTAVSIVAGTLAFLSWGRAIWTSLSSQQQLGLFIFGAILLLTTLFVFWRARPHVTASTRVVTRVTRRADARSGGGTNPDREMEAEWRSVQPDDPSAEQGPPPALETSQPPREP